MKLNDINTVLGIVLKIASIFALAKIPIDQYIDHKIDQKLKKLGFKLTKNNRCSSCKDKQR